MIVLALILVMLLLTSCGKLPLPSGGAQENLRKPVVINIDNNKEHQTMEGFGATHLSLIHHRRGDVLSPVLRSRAINTVYNQIGISMGNLEGALLESPGGYDARTNDDEDPFHFDWDGFDHHRAKAMKEELVDLAQPLGFTNYYLAQKINVRWASPWLADIRKTDYNRYLDEAAEQVAAGQIYWRDTYGIVPPFLMLFNEPLSGNKELKTQGVHHVVDLVKRVGARLRKEGFQDIKFIIPNEETEEKSLRTAIAVLSDSEARTYIGAIGYHPYPYGSPYASIPKILKTSGVGRPDSGRIAIREKLRDLGKQYGIPVWMTEVSHGEVDPLSFEAFRGRAIHIHDELVYADAAAYFGMNNMWDAVTHKLHFGKRNENLFSREGSIILIHNETETVYTTGIGYAIGHFARWVKKGAVRIEATCNDPLLQVVAFRHDGQKRLVVVIINNAPAERTLQVNVNGLTLSGKVEGEQSTAKAYWEPIGPFAPATSTSFLLSVPAESVTSIPSDLAGSNRQKIRN